MHIGKAIKAELTARRIGPTEFANILGGIDRQNIYQIFKKRSVQLRTAKKYAEGLEMSVSELIQKAERYS